MVLRLLPVARDRHLNWEGCHNVRDLGGMSAPGGETRWGELIRGDEPSHLTEAGWAALESHGVRTVIDLRNEAEVGPDIADRPNSVTTVHLPLDGLEHDDYWDHWAQEPPPLYYGTFLERFPERTATVLKAIANAPPGGVYFHCVGGRDRTGLIALLLLALAHVPSREIADDHELSLERVGPIYERLGRDDRELNERLLRGHGTTPREIVLATLGTLDVEAHLREGGLDDAELAGLAGRLVTG